MFKSWLGSLKLHKINLKAADISSSEGKLASLACVSTEGILYLWCNPTPGRKFPTSSYPTKVPTSEKMAQVALGTDHMLTLGISGTVYSSGKKTSGQLGRPNATNFSILHLEEVGFPTKQTTIQIACRGPHSAALTASGLVYVWGKSLVDNYKNIKTPTRIDLFFDSIDHSCIMIKSISMSSSNKYRDETYILALTKDNKLYAWGKDPLGQCGIRIDFSLF